MKLKPPQFVALSFLLAILVASILLYLPISQANGRSLSYLDCLFTATTATCVTGLTVVDIGSDFSKFGQLVILFFIQIGGLGIMTFSTVFAILLGRKLTIRQNVIVQSALDQTKIEGLTDLIFHIVVMTLFIEAIGIGILYLRWRELLEFRQDLVLYYAVFHGISAFCNAGLSLFSDNLYQFRFDPITILTVSSLIILGGLGFVVLLDVPKMKFWRKDRALILARLNLQTKVAITITFYLLLIGTVLIYLLEYKGALFGLPSSGGKLMNAFFLAVTPRTAGFSTLFIRELSATTLFLLIALMFIGASPGGTGGGIKTTTFGILLSSIRSMLRGKDELTLFERTVPKTIFHKSAIIFVLSLTWIVVATFLLMISDRNLATANNFFMQLLFETTSAFGTVGLSTGITPFLSPLGKLIIIVTMYLGRIGPLTLAMAIVLRPVMAEYKYSEEKIMVG
ncbi:MAG: hypothetical protein AMJ78_03880 [Omnitrophica WOR_2 bacterium SM23_29]|nr:MAG: hypothetical protein AMJ78_03880 [Omnitrophica WOR_2 bacterium SM23_29]